MKRKRILVRRNQSRIETPKENIWFYSEGSQAAPPIINQKKSSRNNWKSVAREETESRSLDEPQRMVAKKTNLFVVDWQMSEVL